MAEKTQTTPCKSCREYGPVNAEVHHSCATCRTPGAYYGKFWPRGPFKTKEVRDWARNAIMKARRTHQFEWEDKKRACVKCGLEPKTKEDRDSECSNKLLVESEVWEKRELIKKLNAEQIGARYPALVAHIICESLGYARPSLAAMILHDVIHGKENWCEWIYSCYKCRPDRMLIDCIKGRHRHKGYMASFPKALGLVLCWLDKNEEPDFASWF